MTATAAEFTAAPATVAPTQARKTPLTGTAPSGLPGALVYDDWTVTDGVITSACPSGAICSDEVSGKGLLQREVVVAGESYFQTIVAEKTDTGSPTIIDFSDAGLLSYFSESFVSKNNGEEGLANKSRLATEDLVGTAPNNMSIDTEIKSGWARGGPADPVFELRQSQLDVSGFLSSVSSDFTMKRLEDDSRYMMLLTDAPALAGWGGINFATQIIEGGFQTTERVATAGGLLANGDFGGVVDGDIAWSPGDTLQVSWGGYLYFPYMSSPPTIHINTQSYRNLTTGDSSSASDVYQGQDGTVIAVPLNPESWAAPFDNEPVFGDQSLNLPW